MTDYDREYRNCASACGEPFPEFVEFFRSSEPPLSVLDLGCGQGRDSLVAARRGHLVLGVDIAASGIEQLSKVAIAEDLDLQCATQDIEEFDAGRQYDVVVLDRVLHMIKSDERRLTMLGRAQDWVAPGGHILIADTKKNREMIRGCFSDDTWKVALSKKDTLFVRLIDG